MAHRQVSKTRTSATGCVRTHYWLKPPCLLARCPISCQNSRKLSSPSLFLSNDLMSWSTTAGSAESCRKTGRDWTCVIYNQPAPVSHSGGCSVEIQLVRACVCALAQARARALKRGGKVAPLTCYKEKKMQHQRPDLAAGAAALSPSSGYCVYFAAISFSFFFFLNSVSRGKATLHNYDVVKHKENMKTARPQQGKASLKSLMFDLLLMIMQWSCRN